MHDLVIRNATIVDGTGAPARHGDIAIDTRHYRRTEPQGRAPDGANRRLRPVGGSRLGLHPYPLRRPGGFGIPYVSLQLERRDHRGDGQLRGGFAPVRRGATKAT